MNKSQWKFGLIPCVLKLNIAQQKFIDARTVQWILTRLLNLCYLLRNTQESYIEVSNMKISLDNHTYRGLWSLRRSCYCIGLGPKTKWLVIKVGEPLPFLPFYPSPFFLHIQPFSLGLPSSLISSITSPPLFFSLVSLIPLNLVICFTQRNHDFMVCWIWYTTKSYLCCTGI